MLISPECLELNKRLHDDTPSYGTTGKRWAVYVGSTARNVGIKQAIDYGCGKEYLAEGMMKNFSYLKFTNYDPCLEGKDKRPETPARIVTVTNVLEHVETELLDNVLDDIDNLSGQIIFITILTRPAAKTFADGRNIVLTQRPAKWWKEKLAQKWDVKDFVSTGNEILVVCQKKNIGSFKPYEEGMYGR